MHKRIILMLSLALLGATACIIGPKQDDPANEIIDNGNDDGGLAADTSIATDTGTSMAPDVGSADTSPASTMDDGAADGDASDAKMDGDAVSDALDGDVGDTMDGG
jgi:hypothetical protein